MSEQAVIDVQAAAGYILDLFVAMALGAELKEEEKGRYLVWWKTEGMADKYSLRAPAYSTDWALGGPIIREHLIDLCHHHTFPPTTTALMWNPPVKAHHREPLVAAMRAFVLCVLGPTVTIPASLLDGYIESTQRQQDARGSLDRFARESGSLVGIDAPRHVQPSDHVDVHATADAARARVSALGKQLT